MKTVVGSYYSDNAGHMQRVDFPLSQAVPRKRHLVDGNFNIIAPIIHLQRGVLKVMFPARHFMLEN